MKYFIAILLLINCFCLCAQSEWLPRLETYNQAQESLFLLKNENTKIPLTGSDFRNFRHTYAGETNVVSKFIALYKPVISLELNKDDKTSSDTGLRLLTIDLSTIVFDEQTINAIENSIKDKRTIVVLFDEDYKIKRSPIDFSKSDHLLYVKGNSKLHQSLAMQAIFGGIAVKATLAEDLNNAFRKGDGYTLAGGLRLNYAPPEVVGVNGTFLRKEIGSIAQAAVDAEAFPGCQVLVVKDQQVIFHEAWGYHTYDKKRKVQLDDIYDFASLTKVTSALPAMMRLHGESKLNLDDPFKNYFSKIKNTNKAELSIRSILAHQAQLKPWIPYWRSTIKENGKFKWRTFKKKKSRRFPIHITDQLYLHRSYKKKIYKAIKASPLNEKEGYVYSGLAFYLWPEMVSNLVDADFETHLKNTFYKPLGATTLTYNPTRYYPLDRIIPTENDTFFRKVQIHGKVHDEGAVMMGGVSANAGLFGSANDLAKLMQMYLNEGSYGGEQFIAAESVREFTRCQYCGEGNRRGLGFDKPLIEYHPQKSSVAKDASPDSYGHSGYTGTFTWVDPKHQLIYIFFSNRVYPTRENRKIYQLNVRPRIHQVIYDSFLKNTPKTD